MPTGMNSEDLKIISLILFSLNQLTIFMKMRSFTQIEQLIILEEMLLSNMWTLMVTLPGLETFLMFYKFHSVTLIPGISSRHYVATSSAIDYHSF